MSEIGNKVICISTPNGYSESITIGKIYTIVDTNQSGSIIKILDDNDYRITFLRTHFISLEDNRNEIINDILN